MDFLLVNAPNFRIWGAGDLAPPAEVCSGAKQLERLCGWAKDKPMEIERGFDGDLMVISWNLMMWTMNNGDSTEGDDLHRENGVIRKEKNDFTIYPKG